jgi:hypothetical protein
MSLLALLALIGTSPAFAAGGDADGDGFELSDDCDDADASVFPGAAEVCNGVDDDCNGQVDEGSATDASTWYRDSDEDGHGDSNFPAVACSAPAGYVSDGDDCDDGSAAAYPGAEETCDGFDNDCDGAADEDGASGGSTWYIDADGDDYGDPASAVTGCARPDDAVADGSDCDDTDASVHPTAADAWYDGVDADCDGNDADADGDGFDAITAGGDDCDDADATVNPGGDDSVYNGVDSDCSGSDLDADGDGFESTLYGGADCDDTDPTVYPGAQDDPYDGVVNDCDARDELDADLDGFAAVAAGGTDCDDTDPAVNPGASEEWYDGVDADCDGNDADADGDGFDAVASGGTDCADDDPDIYPDAPGYDAECVELPDPAELAAARFRGGGGCAALPTSTGLWTVLGGLLAAAGVRRRVG